MGVLTPVPAVKYTEVDTNELIKKITDMISLHKAACLYRNGTWSPSCNILDSFRELIQNPPLRRIHDCSDCTHRKGN